MAMYEADRERTAIILYGTETGTSHDLAEEICQILERLHFSIKIAEADAVPAAELPKYTLAVFVISTTGQGDFPSNARKLWTSLLRRKLTTSFLEEVSYALVGLGDSSYPKFNWAARKLDKRLKQLGAHELVDPCEADEQGGEGTDGAFLAWVGAFRSMLYSNFPLENGRQPIPDDFKLPSKWRLERDPLTPEVNRNVSEGPTKNGTHLLDCDQRTIPGAFEATLKSNARLTPVDHWQDVRLLTLEITDHLEYYPGDALSILPKNASQTVDMLIRQMNWLKVADVPLYQNPTLDAPDLSKYAAPPVPYVSKDARVTLRQLLTDYLDINAIPKRSFFSSIASYTENEMHKERLVEFTKPEYLDEYYDYATRPRRSTVEILQEFDSVQIPWQEAVNVFPLLRPRQFSIASGGELKHSSTTTRFELLVAIVKYRTIIKRTREGVCTRYLGSLQAGSTLKIVMKTEGRFHTKPADVLQAHLLIGPGTGVGPLRALIHEKTLQSVRLTVNTVSMLVYGSRNARADFFFEEEWHDLVHQGSNLTAPPLEISTAFSRDQKTKVYVQDRIREAADRVSNLLRNLGATVIVCGSSGHMPKAVRAALLDALATGKPSGSSPLTRDEAEALLAEMEKRGRYKQETW